MDRQKSHTSKVINDGCVLFWDCLEPFYGVVRAFPQVHLSCLDDFFVYAVQDVFADDTNFKFAWNNESAGRVVNEIWLWSFRVMKESLDAETSIRSASSIFSAIFLSSRVIISGTFGFVFLQVFVFLYKCHIVFGCSLVIVCRFVCFHKNVVFFLYFFYVFILRRLTIFSKLAIL